MSRIWTVFRAGVAELRRTPLLLALLAFGPAYLIYVFTLVAPDSSAVLYLGEETLWTTLPDAFPAFTTPMTAALLSGITGLFLMEAATTADFRIVVAGYRAYQVVLARLGLIIVVAAVSSSVSVGVMLTAFQPELLGWFILGTTLTALIYGMIGLLVGIFFDRLLGVYLILFGSMIDLFIFQNPLAVDPPDLAGILPGHYPLRLAIEAGFKGSITWGNLGWSLGYLTIVTVVGIVGFYRGTQVS